MTTLHLTSADIEVPIIKSKARDGVPVVLSLSAYDVPKAVHVQWPQAGKIMISFEYLNKESSEDVVVDQHLTVVVGKDTAKVLGFHVAPAANPHDVIVRIVAGVEQQLRHATRDLQKLNYRVIEGVVKTKLEGMLTAST